MDLLPIDKDAVRRNSLEPSRGILSRTGFVFTVVISGTGDDVGLLAQGLEVLGNDRDLDFELEVAGNVEEVPCQNDVVITVCRLQQPVKLLEVVVQIRCDKQFQSSCRLSTHGGLFWSSFPRPKGMPVFESVREAIRLEYDGLLPDKERKACPDGEAFWTPTRAPIAGGPDSTIKGS